MRKWLHVFLILLLYTCAAASKQDVKTDNLIRAVYVPLAKHADCNSICDRFSDVPGDVRFSIEQICDWSDLSSLNASGKSKIVFVMCPVSAEKLFKRDNFHVTNALTESLHDLVADAPAAIASGAKKKNKPAKISEKFQKIIDARLKIIQRYALDPLVVNTVNQANASIMSLDKIKELDLQWINKTDSTNADEILSNNISKFLRRKIKSNKLLYTEAFLCDRQGLILGTYPRTSDYWQGDEDKFTECFNSQQIFIGSLEFDESTNGYAVQVSVPVKDSGQTIGVLVVGLGNIK